MRTLGYEDAEEYHRQINSRPAGRRAWYWGNLGLQVARLERGHAGTTCLSCDSIEAIGSHYVHQQDDSG